MAYENAPQDFKSSVEHLLLVSELRDVLDPLFSQEVFIRDRGDICYIAAGEVTLPQPEGQSIQADSKLAQGVLCIEYCQPPKRAKLPNYFAIDIFWGGLFHEEGHEMHMVSETIPGMVQPDRFNEFGYIRGLLGSYDPRPELAIQQHGVLKYMQGQFLSIVNVGTRALLFGGVPEATQNQQQKD
jgi:hypothetical protein